MPFLMTVPTENHQILLAILRAVMPGFTWLKRLNVMYLQIYLRTAHSTLMLSLGKRYFDSIIPPKRRDMVLEVLDTTLV